MLSVYDLLFLLSRGERSDLSEIPTAVGFSPLALPPAEGDITTGITTRTQWGSIFLLAVSLQRRALVFSFHIYLEKTLSFWVKHAFTSNFPNRYLGLIIQWSIFLRNCSGVLSAGSVPQKHNCLTRPCTDFTIITMYYLHNTSSEMLTTL